MCHGTRFEWCSISVMTSRSPARTLAAPHAYATRLIASVALRVKMVPSGVEPGEGGDLARAPS